jgi:hypothetical protein
LKVPESVLPGITNVQKIVLVPGRRMRIEGVAITSRHELVFLVYGTHQRCRWWQDLIHEYEDGLLRCELDSLSNDINELADSQILKRELARQDVEVDERRVAQMEPDISSCQS